MRRKFEYAFVVTLSLAVLLCSLWYSRHNLSGRCSASTVLLVNKADKDAFLSHTLTITFSYSGKAYLHITGDFHHDGQIYMVNRSTIFDYSRVNKSEYQIHAVDATRAGNDTVPVAMENRFLMPTLKDTQRLIRIERLPTGDLIFHNSAGPFLICATH